MCFHVSTPTKEKLSKLVPPGTGITDLKPIYHTSGFAHPQLPVMSSRNPHEVALYEWGLIPVWASDARQAAELMNKTLNARSETIFTTPMFRSAARHRCLVFVDGFFEWKHEGRKKLPHYIQMPDHEAFALGGLWTWWTDPQTAEVHATCSIITTAANELMATIHNTKKRMPLILPERHWSLWLDEEAPAEEIQRIMQPCAEGLLQAYPVSNLITARGADTNVPEVQAPLPAAPGLGF